MEMINKDEEIVLEGLLQPFNPGEPTRSNDRLSFFNH